jgi:hypothetical protein
VARLGGLALSLVLAAACAAPPGPAPATPTPVPVPGALTHDDMQYAINAVQGDPQNFGGLWWDSTGWPLHIAVVSTDPAIRAKVEQWVPPGASVAWHQVKHSYSELDAIQNTIVGWLNSHIGDRGDVNVNSTGIDVIRNIVTVRLTQHAPAWEADLSSRYGDAVELVIEPAPQPI